MVDILDIFNMDAFNHISLTARVNRMDFTPSLLGSLGVFDELGITTTVAAFEEDYGEIKLIQSSERGAPGETKPRDPRKMRYINVPHLQRDDALNADEILGRREFGVGNTPGQGLMSAQSAVDRLLMKHTRDLDATLENHRLGSIQGIVKDADGSDLVNLFTEFNVTQLPVINFELDTATTNVRGKCSEVRRAVSTALGATANAFPNFEIWCPCGHSFFDKLISHDDVKEAYARWQDGARLFQDYTYGSFDFAGINFVDYKGTDDGTSIAIADTAGHCFARIPGLFSTFFAPADTFDAVNTVGIPRYALTVPEDAKNKRILVEVQSNPLTVCLKPDSLQEVVEN